MMAVKKISFNGLQVFDKKSSGSGIINGSNYQLANELHNY